MFYRVERRHTALSGLSYRGHTSQGTFLICSSNGFPKFNLSNSFVYLSIILAIFEGEVTWRVFTITALKPGRNTFGAVEFVFGVSGRCGPELVEASVEGILEETGLGAETVAVGLLDTLLRPLLAGSTCCAKARKSASEASSK